MMFNSPDILDYFMQARTLSNGLNVYPIKLKDYDTFSLLATQYIVLDIEQRNNQIRQQLEKERKLNEFKELPYKSIFECLVGVCNESITYQQNIINAIKQRNKTVTKIKEDFISKNGKEQFNYLLAQNPNLIDEYELLPTNFENQTLSQVYQLLEILFQADVLFKDNMFEVSKDGIILGYLNESNFDEFRSNVMDANLLFKPMIAPRLNGQRAIEKQIILKQKKGVETSMATMFATIKATYKISDEELMDLTYFRFKYDYSVAEILHFNEMNYIGRMFGNSSKVTNLCEKIQLNNNPYDGLYKITKSDTDKVIK